MINKVKRLVTGLRSSLLIPLALGLMGNQSCEQSQDQGRVLKKKVGVDALKSQPLPTPDGKLFDFGYVMNAQLPGALYKQNLFLFEKIGSIVDTSKDSGEKIQGLSASSQKILGSEYQRDMLAYKLEELQNDPNEMACLLNYPQFRLNGKVLSFEASDSYGGSFGFNEGGAFSGGFGIGVTLQFDSAQLAMTMSAYRQELGESAGLMVPVNVTKKQTQTHVSFSFLFDGFGLSPSATFRPTMASLAENTLNLGLQQIKATERMKQDPFYVRVMEEHDTTIVIFGGSNVGIQKGDRFTVMNQKGKWKGQPCQSQFEYAYVTEELAIIEIITVDDVVSVGRVLDPKEGGIEYSTAAKIGAKVVLKSLYDASAKPKATASATTTVADSTRALKATPVVATK